MLNDENATSLISILYIFQCYKKFMANITCLKNVFIYLVVWNEIVRRFSSASQLLSALSAMPQYLLIRIFILVFFFCCSLFLPFRINLFVKTCDDRGSECFILKMMHRQRNVKLLYQMFKCKRFISINVYFFLHNIFFPSP